MTKYADLFAPTKGNEPREAMPDSPEELESRPKKFTLLFVDDEPNVLEGLRRVFRRENYCILTATSAEEALRVMEANPVQLVISDHRMPLTLGADLLRQIKEQWPETIRIMLTGHADVQAIMGAVSEGAVYKFITKPCNDDDLRLTVSLALEQFSLQRENKKLSKLTKEQHARITKYSSVFKQSRGILGNILVRANVITDDQFKRAMNLKNAGESLGEALVRLGYAAETAIMRELRKDQGLESIDLKEVQVNQHVARFFPRELCATNRLIPVRLDGKDLTLAMADPSDIMKIDHIAMWTGFNVVPVVAKSSDIMGRIAEIYGEDGEKQDIWDCDNPLDLDPMDEIDIVLEEDVDATSVEQLISTSSVPPIVRIVNAVIGEALRSAASDIHIEPKTKHSLVRYRIDGMLYTKIKIPPSLHPPAVSRIKILAKMDVSERRRPQDGRISVRSGTKIVDIRVSTMPTIKGEKVVMRILDQGANVQQTSELGMLENDLQRLKSLIAMPEGMLIATGPTGSGKTTTLYSILNQMLQPTKNLETIEDPVEYFLEDANQVHVKESIGLSFGTVLKATLRQDPDVILVGEIRDFDTADAAFKAALTGHMVLTSLHTNDTIASITRLMDIGIKPYLIASALQGVIAQRLVRKICRHCKTTTLPNEDTLRLLKVTDLSMKQVTIGKGCERCNNSGYSGRVGIFEVFLVSDEFRQLISGNFRDSEITTLARVGGMTTLREDAFEKVRRGDTTLEEVLRVLGPPAELKRPCAGCGQTLDSKFSYCPHCGTYGKQTCRHCSTPLEEDWKICPSCGAFRDCGTAKIPEADPDP